MKNMDEIWTIEDVLHCQFGDIEIGIEKNHILFLQKPNKYKHVKSNNVFYVYKINIQNGNFFYENVFIKKRYAKKVYNKIKKGLENENGNTY